MDDRFQYLDLVIPMDDGIRLYGWLQYREPLEPRAVALTVSIYGLPFAFPLRRSALDLVGEDDFVWAYVHVRGMGSSEGTYDQFGPRTVADARAILDFVTNQSWSTGSAVSLGVSGAGIFNYANAASGHPSLKAVAAISTVFDFYRDVGRPGGAFPGPIMATLKPFLELLLELTPNVDARERVGIRTDVIADQLDALRSTLATAEQETTCTQWWQERSFSASATSATVPILLGSSFFDLTAWNGALHAFLSYPNAWLHMGLGHDGPQRISESHGLRYQRDFLRHFGLGEANGFDTEPRVALPIGTGSRMGYAYGEVPLRAATSWPLPETTWTRLYLGDRSLSLTAPEAGLPDDLPIATALPTRADVRAEHRAIALHASRSGDGDLPPGAAAFPPPPEIAALPKGDEEAARAVGDALADLRVDEMSQLTFTSPAFTKNVELTGPVTLTLFASSTLPDFVWMVSLTDVWPDGTSMWVGEQTLRAALRRVDPDRSVSNQDGDIVMVHCPFDQEEPLETGKVEGFTIDCGAIANVFRPGHHLRLDLAAVTLDPAPAGPCTEAPPSPGTVTVHRSSTHPSSLLIPLIPAMLADTPMAFQEHRHPGQSVATLREALA